MNLFMESVSHSVMSDSLRPCGLCSPPGSSVHGQYFLGKNTGVGCHFLLQEIFLTQGSNLGLQHCRQILYHLSHQGISVNTFSVKPGLDTETPEETPYPIVSLPSRAISCEHHDCIENSQSPRTQSSYYTQHEHIVWHTLGICAQHICSAIILKKKRG